MFRDEYRTSHHKLLFLFPVRKDIKAHDLPVRSGTIHNYSPSILRTAQPTTSSAQIIHDPHIIEPSLPSPSFDMMQFLAFFLLLALSAGALPQASNPDTLAPSSTPSVDSTAATNIDKRGKDPVIGLFNDPNCQGEHMSEEIPMTTGCTKFKPNQTYPFFKVSWHDGPGKLRLFPNDHCTEEAGSNSLFKVGKHEWMCVEGSDYGWAKSFKVPTD